MVGQGRYQRSPVTEPPEVKGEKPLAKNKGSPGVAGFAVLSLIAEKLQELKDPFLILGLVVETCTVCLCIQESNPLIKLLFISGKRSLSP